MLQLKAVCRLPFAVCRLPFAVCRLPFAVCRLPFALIHNRRNFSLLASPNNSARYIEGVDETNVTWRKPNNSHIYKIIFGLVFLIPLIFTLATCDNDTTSESEPDLVKYGDLVLDGGGTIPIYKTKDVTDAQMAIAVGNATDAYNNELIQTERDNLIGKIDAIHIAPNDYNDPDTGFIYSYKTINGKKVLVYRCGRTAASLGGLLTDIANGVVTLAMLLPTDAPRLAGYSDNPQSPLRSLFLEDKPPATLTTRTAQG